MEESNTLTRCVYSKGIQVIDISINNDILFDGVALRWDRCKSIDGNGFVPTIRISAAGLGELLP